MRRTMAGGVSALCLLATLGAAAQGYEGVAPGSGKIPDGIAAAPGKDAMLTWPGFQMLPEGGSRVFLQTSVKVTPTLKRVGDRFQVILSGVSLPKGNAQRPLETSFFETPVTSVHAYRKGRDVIVELTMRANVTPTMRTEKADTGYFFTMIDFPAGSYR